MKEGKIEGKKVSFHLDRDIQGMKMKIKWVGNITGEDEIKFKREVEAGYPIQCRVMHSYMKAFFARCLTMSIVALIMLLRVQLPASAGQLQSAACDCFPFESLSPELRTRAERMLLEVLDSEGLYTIAADIKPMSDVGFKAIDAPPIFKDRSVCLSGMLVLVAGLAIIRWHNVWRRNLTMFVAISGVFLLFLGLFRIATRTSRNVDELDQIMRVWKCGGEVSGGLWWYDVVYDDQHSMSMIVFNIPKMAEVIANYKDFFSSIGVSSSSPELDVVNAMERTDWIARHRGCGLLYGYPEYAVDFFVDAYRQHQVTGEFVERDFILLPTFRGDSLAKAPLFMLCRKVREERMPTTSSLIACNLCSKSISNGVPATFVTTREPAFYRW